MNLPRLVTVGSAAMVSIVLGCSDQPVSAPSVEGDTATTKQALDTPTGFDFDNGNIVAEYIIGTLSPILSGPNGVVTGGDASIILNVTTTLTAGWFDAVAPYSATMVGVHSQIPRRPAAEGATERNRNIANMYVAHRMLNVLLPQHKASWRAMLSSKGLDPDNKSMDLTTPAGIGNYAAQAVLDARARDGLNRDGDETGRKYNRKMYEDYTGYEPVNSPFELKDPSRWQPKVITKGNGLFQIQKYVTPQWGLTKPYSFPRKDLKKYRVPEPTNSDYKKNRAGYKAQADEVLAASANLTDQKKMLVEFFNHKNQSLGRSAEFIRQRDGLTVEQFIQYEFLINMAAFDGGIAVWSEKTRFDTVRPWTAIKFLYEKKKLRAWGGVGKGTVDDITGDEWESYINPVGDHPEYPSGSSCFCAATAQAARRWTGTDQFGWSVVRAAGSSVIEPGITPATDVTMQFDTWSGWVRECADSRVNGGVHFRSAVEASLPVCTAIADRAYEFIMPYVNGTVNAQVSGDDDQGEDD